MGTWGCHRLIRIQVASRGLMTPDLRRGDDFGCVLVTSCDHLCSIFQLGTNTANCVAGSRVWTGANTDEHYSGPQLQESPRGKHTKDAPSETLLHFSQNSPVNINQQFSLRPFWWQGHSIVHSLRLSCNEHELCQSQGPGWVLRQQVRYAKLFHPWKSW